MIPSRKRLGRILREEIRDVVMRSWPFSERQGMVKERVLARRVIMMEDHRI